MNDYKALRTFLLAAEKRNFAQVARELDMTPAAVTRAIAALEEDLGVQLFVRTTRQVSLTTDGAIYAAQIQPAMDALETARKDVMNTHKADHGRLRISAPTWFGQQVLPPILAGFREQFPKISFEISLADGLVNIIDDDYDLAIRISAAPSDKFTIWRKISVVRRILVAAPEADLRICNIPTNCHPTIASLTAAGANARPGPCRMAVAMRASPRVGHSVPTMAKSLRAWLSMGQGWPCCRGSMLPSICAPEG